MQNADFILNFQFVGMCSYCSDFIIYDFHRTLRIGSQTGNQGNYLVSQSAFLFMLTHKFLDMVTSCQLFLNLHAVPRRNYDPEITARNLSLSFYDSTGHPLITSLSFVHFWPLLLFCPHTNLSPNVSESSTVVFTWNNPLLDAYISSAIKFSNLV